jgi:hypothetical protein
MALLFVLLMISSITWLFTYKSDVAQNTGTPVKSNSNDAKNAHAGLVDGTKEGHDNNAGGGSNKNIIANNDQIPPTNTPVYNGIKQNRRSVISFRGNKQSIAGSAALTPGQPQATGIAKPGVIYKRNYDSVSSSFSVNTYSPKTGAHSMQAPVGSNDSSGDEAITKEKMLIQAGLQWNAQLPFSGASKYFYGPGASSQPYRLALPGVWLSLEAEKNLLIAEVNLFTTTVFNPKPFYTGTKVIDAQTSITETKKLNKLFGLSAAFRYSYNMQGNWWLGWGLQTNFWKKGVTGSDAEKDHNGTKTYYQTTQGLNDSDWQHLNKFQLRTDAELVYKTPRWHAGVRTGFFFTGVAKDANGPSSPLQVDLFFRLSLYSSNKKKK